MRTEVYEQVDILDFEKDNNLDLVIIERDANLTKSTGYRYYCHFSNCEIMRNGCLIGEFGNGNSFTEAIKDYATQLSKHRVAINSYSENRREIEVPILTYTEKKEK